MSALRIRKLSAKAPLRALPSIFCRIFTNERHPHLQEGRHSCNTIGAGTTRIDAVLANVAAAHAVVKCEYLYTWSTAFGRVPFRLELDVKSFQDFIRVAVQPDAIIVRTLAAMSDKDRKARALTRLLSSRISGRSIKMPFRMQSPKTRSRCSYDFVRSVRVLFV